jgi:hypothetical protein
VADEGLLLQHPRIWRCASKDCDAAARTVSQKVPWHSCKALRGLTAPLIPDGERAHVVAVDREDYVGSEDVRVDGDGRPVMALNVERPDGSNDRVVYAPTATASADDLEEAASSG